MRSILFTALVLTVLVSCNNTDKPETTDNSTSVADSIINAVPLPSGGETAPALGGDAPTSASTSDGAASGKLNPPHGEPGHRCEIAVGAPLDSEPTSPPTTTINNSSSPSLTTPTFTTPPPTQPAGGQQEKVVTAPGMNPPHGEPGHDCAIPVGAPLKK
jgi:hypothetical protein